MNPEPPVTRSLTRSSDFARGPTPLGPAIPSSYAAARSPAHLQPRPRLGVDRPLRSAVVERHAEVVGGDPVAVRELVVGAEDAVAGLIVYAAGRTPDRLEDQILVMAGDHP